MQGFVLFQFEWSKMKRLKRELMLNLRIWKLLAMLVGVLLMSVSFATDLITPPPLRAGQNVYTVPEGFMPKGMTTANLQSFSRQ